MECTSKEDSEMKLSCDIAKKNSVRNLIKELERYRDGLETKCEIFVSRLAEVGIKAINASLGGISPFYKGHTSAVLDGVYKDGDSYKAVIRMFGDQALFIEFGSGVTFNTQKGGSLHPKGKELGMTIGSYNPNSDNATNPWGWYYTDEYGQSQHTYGTPTFAPMYQSYLQMRAEIVRIAKEVFK